MDEIREPTFKFKFQFIGENGQPTTMLSRKGQFDGETLVLDQLRYPVEALLVVEHRQKRVMLVVPESDNQSVMLTLQFGDQKLGKKLKQKLDVARSRIWADKHREELEQKGLYHEFRVSECKHCRSTIVLSQLPITPQQYCPYCDTLMTMDDSDPQVPSNEHLFRICDHCGLFSQPQTFTVFYFWFLLVVYGFSVNEKYCCRTCIRNDAWKMLFGNLVFILGVPVAVTQLVRSYSGRFTGGAFRGLDSGNAHAIAGNTASALPHYKAILERMPHSAGVKFNLGRGLLSEQQAQAAAKVLEAALQDCGNYVPAYGLLRQVYEQLGETAKLKALDAMWGNVETPPEEHEPDRFALPLDQQDA